MAIYSEFLLDNFLVYVDGVSFKKLAMSDVVSL